MPSGRGLNRYCPVLKASAGGRSETTVRPLRVFLTGIGAGLPSITCRNSLVLAGAYVSAIGAFTAEGVWDRIHAVLLMKADAAETINWTVSVDRTINRRHQRGDRPSQQHRGPPQLQETPD